MKTGSKKEEEARNQRLSYYVSFQSNAATWRRWILFQLLTSKAAFKSDLCPPKTRAVPQKDTFVKRMYYCRLKSKQSSELCQIYVILKHSWSWFTLHLALIIKLN